MCVGGGGGGEEQVFPVTSPTKKKFKIGLGGGGGGRGDREGRESGKSVFPDG